MFVSRKEGGKITSVKNIGFLLYRTILQFQVRQQLEFPGLQSHNL